MESVHGEHRRRIWHLQVLTMERCPKGCLYLLARARRVDLLLLLAAPRGEEDRRRQQLKLNDGRLLLSLVVLLLKCVRDFFTEPGKLGSPAPPFCGAAAPSARL